MRSVLLYARNVAGQTTGIVEEFTGAEIVPRYNDVGTWSIDDVPLGLAAELGLLEKGAGIRVRDENDTTTILSGPITRRTRTRDSDTNTVSFFGADDAIWLARRVTHPQPATAAPPYNVTAYDASAASRASTLLRHYVDVNAGPSAIAARRVPGLALAADPLIGNTFPARARWYSLLSYCQYLAWAGGIGFRLRDLVFEPYAVADKSAAVVFSDEQGSIASFTYTIEAPEENYEYAGGSGEGTARLILEGQDSSSVALWGRAEGFIDRRDTVDPNEIQPEIDRTIVDKGPRQGVEIVPIDMPGRAYLTDYRLGDRISCIVDDVKIVDTVTKVTISLGDDGLTVRPFVGNPAVAPKAYRLFDRLRSLERRTRNLEAI